MRVGRRDFIKTLLVGVAGISIYGYLEPIQVEVNKVRFNLGLNKKVLFITDTHLHGVELLDKKIIKIISRLIGEADLVLLGGDQYDEMTPNLNVLHEFLNVITQKEAYYVNGNHEHWSNNKFPLKEVEQFYSRYGLEPLNNKALWIDNIIVGGLDWIFDEPSIAREYASKVGEVDILVSHTPDSFAYVTQGYKLMLAGHTHGGQILNGMLGTNSRMGYVSGIYRDGDRIMYLSRGAGEMLPIRLLTPREITLIEV